MTHGTTKDCRKCSQAGGAKNSRARVGDEVGALVGDEVAAVGDELDPHVVGVTLVAGQHLRAQGPVVGSEHQSRRHHEALAGVATADDRQRLSQVEGPVHLHGGPGPRRLGEVAGEGVQRPLVPGLAPGRAADQDLGYEVAAAVEPVAETRSEDQPLVPEAPEVRHHRPHAHPGRDDVEGEEALEPLRRPQAEQEADPATPVVADQLHPLQPQLVEHGEHVGRHLLLLIAVAGGVGPAEAAQVERQHPVAVGQRRHQVSPLVPVLGPAVQAEHGVVPGPGFGDVEVDPPRPHRAVGDAVDVRRSGHPPASVNAAPPRLPDGSRRASRPSCRRRRRPFPATACLGAPAGSSARCR